MIKYNQIVFTKEEINVNITKVRRYQKNARNKRVSLADFISMRNRITDLEGEIEILKKEQVIDAMTGVHTKKHFKEALEREFLRIERMKQNGQTIPFSAIAFCDLDHFKSLNDTLGHNVGDDGIRAFATALKASVRESDLVARYGGDEFIILFDEASSEEVLFTIIRRIQRAVRAITLPNWHKKFTASIGVSYVSSQDKTYEEWINRADKDALYYSKDHGRDQATLLNTNGTFIKI